MLQRLYIVQYQSPTNFIYICVVPPLLLGTYYNGTGDNSGLMIENGFYVPNNQTTIPTAWAVSKPMITSIPPP